MIARIKVKGYVEVEIPMPERENGNYYPLDSEQLADLIDDALNYVDYGNLKDIDVDFEEWL